jgi:hypothetical protein
MAISREDLAEGTEEIACEKNLERQPADVKSRSRAPHRSLPVDFRASCGCVPRNQSGGLMGAPLGCRECTVNGCVSTRPRSR